MILSEKLKTLLDDARDAAASKDPGLTRKADAAVTAFLIANPNVLRCVKLVEDLGDFDKPSTWTEEIAALADELHANG